MPHAPVKLFPDLISTAVPGGLWVRDAGGVAGGGGGIQCAGQIFTAAKSTSLPEHELAGGQQEEGPEGGEGGRGEGPKHQGIDRDKFSQRSIISVQAHHGETESGRFELR